MAQTLIFRFSRAPDIAIQTNAAVEVMESAAASPSSARALPITT
jgi:hypothetical protein